MKGDTESWSTLLYKERNHLIESVVRLQKQVDILRGGHCEIVCSPGIHAQPVSRWALDEELKIRGRPYEL